MRTTDVMIHNHFYKSNNKIYWANIKNYSVNYTNGGRVCSVVNHSQKSLYELYKIFIIIVNT